ncbi:Uncharacterised protein [Mycobacteroides abscessus subsp. abscessus]|nr:Uncharacterised protein [Mycobacteroides abscessus subsp. abscessus]
MSDTQPALSLRYFLNLEESQDGFALATFGKKQFTRFITPLMSVAIIAWGFYLGFDGVGRYYVALGAFFLILQTLMRTNLEKVSKVLIYFRTMPSCMPMVVNRYFITTRCKISL